MDGRPIAGAIVTLNGSAAIRPPRAPRASGPPRLMTDDRGQFVARGLRRGTLFLNVTKGGYVDATLGQRRPGGSTQPLQIGEAQRLTNVEVRMWRHAVIAGTVVDDAGEPVVGTRVQAFRRTISAGHLRFVAGADSTTDDRGIYRIAGLTPGEFEVAAAASRLDESLIVYSTTFHTAADSPREAAVVRVRSGEERGNTDIQVRPIRPVRVSGVVLAPNGLASRVPLRLIPETGGLVAGLDVETTTSDAAGAFTFTAVPPGSYVLSAIRAAGSEGASPSQMGDNTYWGEQAVGIGDADVNGIALTLRPGPRLGGRVEFDGSGERPDMTRLATVRITLDPADGLPLADALVAAAGRIDAGGQFTTPGVPAGRYFLRVTGLADWSFKAAFHEGRDLADEPIDLASDDVSDVVITFTDRP